MSKYSLKGLNIAINVVRSNPSYKIAIKADFLTPKQTYILVKMFFNLFKSKQGNIIHQLDTKAYLDRDHRMSRGQKKSKVFGGKFSDLKMQSEMML